MDWISKKLRLSLEQREILHDEMQAVKRGGRELTKKEIIDMGKQVKKDYPNK